MEMIRNKTYINYYQKSKMEMDLIHKQGIRPSIAMHVCCGPCSTWPIEFLNTTFKVTVIYDNPNIYPEAEYQRRLEELKRYVEEFNKNNNADVELIIFPYNHEEHMDRLKVYGKQKEGGERCQMCYTLRMEECYKYAEEKGFDYFCTVMSISRQKDSQILNQIGSLLEKKYKPKYFYSDFKKKGGDDRKRELIKQYHLYNQLYCGCEYSYAEFVEKVKAKALEEGKEPDFSGIKEE
jgi:predicted adenine nucleotide alpha hydrolase (AANH) superfamily ATPase